MTNRAALTLGVAQIASIPGDLSANRQKHVEAIDAARARGVDVLVFPELSLVGHAGGADALRLALRRDDSLLIELARAAGPMCTVVGAVEEAGAAQFYNAAFTLRDGHVLAVHRKINLATYGRLEDGKYFTAGERADVADLNERWRASVLICADLWNPPLVHLAATQGATLLLAPVSSAIEAVGADFDNPGGWEVNLRFHAMTYGLPIAMANRVGREDSLTFYGGSRIVDPFGRTLAKAEGNAEQVVDARVDFESVRKARQQLPTIRDANVRLLAREFDRIARA